MSVLAGRTGSQAKAPFDSDAAKLASTLETMGPLQVSVVERAPFFLSTASPYNRPRRQGFVGTSNHKACPHFGCRHVLQVHFVQSVYKC